MSDLACSFASLQANEPLAGTAVESIDRWLLLEVTDTWAPKVLQSEVFSDAVRARLTEWSEAPRSRLQLIRRPGRTAKRPLFAVMSSSGESRQVELDSYADLVSLDLDMMQLAPSEPTVLVCVHGRRDRCCAQHGAAVYRSLQSRVGDVWQTSHLGGHRFAACVLTLPNGLMYGRLRPEHGDAFAAAQYAGEVGDLDLFRGRCDFDRPTQAAEIFVRRRTGDRAVDALEWIETTPDGDSTWTARFRASSGEEIARVRREETGIMRPASCGGEAEAVTQFVEL
ncbi:MAG: hypothetical protein JSV06_07025 [Myxococcales bacterium]|nr:MAG: hypothetical protein JSV06_07025 [Myxococcales bacterium]